MTLILALALLIPLAAIILDSQFGRALATLVEKRSRGDNGRTEERIALLEGEVERLAQEVRRLEEQADFVQRLLTERASTGSESRRDDA